MNNERTDCRRSAAARGHELKSLKETTKTRCEKSDKCCDM